jgi:hypothetical protein
MSVKRELLDREGNKISTLVIGSSVAQYGIDPIYLPDSSYNMAFANQWLPSNVLFLETYYDKMPHLRTIIWGFTLASLWSDYEKDYTPDQITRDQIYLGLPVKSNLLYNSELITSPISVLKLIKYYIKREPLTLCDSLGLDHLFDSRYAAPGWEHSFSRKMRDYTPIKESEIEVQKAFLENIDAIDRALAFCHEKGIKVHLMMPPTYEDWAKYLNPVQYDEMNAVMIHFTRKWDNVTWHDYSRDPRFDKSDFHDWAHLNSDIGAAKFAKIIRQEIFN